MTPQRDGWRYFGWWRIVLPACLIILTTNTLTLAGTSLGNVLYPSLNTWLIVRYGWREAFAMIALAATMAVRAPRPAVT